MARHRGRQGDTEGEARRWMALAATKEPTEGLGQVVGEKEEGRNSGWSDKALDRVLENVRRPDRSQYKIRLITGAGEWPLIDAECALMDLQEMQKDRPDEFAALVGLVKPRGASHLPDTGSPQSLSKLRDAKLLLPDGSVDQLLAAILDGAYRESKEGVILVNPIQYPGREMFEERERLLGEDAEFGGRVGGQANTRRGKKQGGNDGPSR